MIAASKDPADTARRLRPMAGGEQLQADVSAVLAEHGSDAERGEARKKLTADELAFAIMRWDYKLAETVLRRGDAEAKNEAIKELVDQRDPRLPAIIREAMKHRDDDFPWVDKLIAAMPDMRAGYFHDAQRLLLESDQGRAALVKAVTANPDFMLRALEHLDEVPVKSAQVIAAVQKIAQHPDNEDGGFALAALARLASADPQTHAVWIAALSADDKETRGKAIDALEQAATQEPALHPLWMAAAMRERGLKEMASHLDAGRTKQDDAFAAWKAAQPKPAAAVAQAGAQPAAGAGAWRVPVADMQKAANDPIHAPDLAREAATAHPADAVAIAASFAVAAPAAAPQIAGAVAATQPERAEIVAAAVALSTPFQAVAIAAGVAQTFPQKAAVIAAAVAAVMPAARAAIINAVAEATHQAPESVEQQVAAAAGSVNAVAAAALTAVSASGYGQNTQTAAPPPATSASAGPPVSAAMEEFQQFAFPWPPPPPVVWDTFRDGPNEPLNRRWLGDDNTTLEEVNRRLRAALRAISPDFVSGLFPVPGGFALVTRIERIHRNGEPFHGDMRWSDGNSLKPDWPTYMFYERSGYLRKIVFAVTTDANIRPVAGRKIPPPESGAQNLPGEVGRLTLKDRYVHVLVYAFEKIPEGSFVAFTELSAPRHVETTGLLTYFQPPPHRRLHSHHRRPRRNRRNRAHDARNGANADRHDLDLRVRRRDLPDRVAHAQFSRPCARPLDLRAADVHAGRNPDLQRDRRHRHCSGRSERRPHLCSPRFLSTLPGRLDFLSAAAGLLDDVRRIHGQLFLFHAGQPQNCARAGGCARAGRCRRRAERRRLDGRRHRAAARARSDRDNAAARAGPGRFHRTHVRHGRLAVRAGTDGGKLFPHAAAVARRRAAECHVLLEGKGGHPLRRECSGRHSARW